MINKKDPNRPHVFVANYINNFGVNSINLRTNNKHVEVIDTNSITLTGVANYSYTVIAGSAEVTINGVTISGVPAGFDAKQGDTTPSQLASDITVTGESIGTRVIIYYELKL